MGGTWSWSWLDPKGKLRRCKAGTARRNRDTIYRFPSRCLPVPHCEKGIKWEAPSQLGATNRECTRYGVKETGWVIPYIFLVNTASSKQHSDVPLSLCHRPGRRCRRRCRRLVIQKKNILRHSMCTHGKRRAESGRRQARHGGCRVEFQDAGGSRGCRRCRDGMELKKHP